MHKSQVYYCVPQLHQGNGQWHVYRSHITRNPHNSQIRLMLIPRGKWLCAPSSMTISYHKERVIRTNKSNLLTIVCCKYPFASYDSPLLESQNSLTVYEPSGKCKTPSRKFKSKFPDGEPPGNNHQGWLDRDSAISLTVYRQENTILIS